MTRKKEEILVISNTQVQKYGSDANFTTAQYQIQTKQNLNLVIYGILLLSEPELIFSLSLFDFVDMAFAVISWNRKGFTPLPGEEMEALFYKHQKNCGGR